MATNDDTASINSSDVTNRNVTTVTLTNDSQPAVRSRSSASGNPDHSRITKSRTRASTLPNLRERQSISIFDENAFVAVSVPSTQVTSLDTVSVPGTRETSRSGGPKLTTGSSNHTSGRQRSHAGLGSASVKINTTVKPRSDNLTNKDTRKRNISCQNNRSATNHSDTEVLSSGHGGNVSVASHVRNLEDGSDSRNTRVTIATVTNTVTSPQVSMASSAQALPVTVARGTVASVSVSSRTNRASSQPQVVSSSTRPRNVLQSSSSHSLHHSHSQHSSQVSPQRSPQRSPHRSNQHSRRATNQNRQRSASRVHSEDSLLAIPSSSSERNSNVPHALDPSQLTVDVLQNTRHRGNHGTHTGENSGDRSESPSPTHRIQQWCENTNREALPDILNSHLLPPYAPTRVQNQNRANRSNPEGAQARAQPTHRANRARSHRRGSPGITQIEGSEKECCSKRCCAACVTTLTTFRWVLVAVAVLGVVCVAIGIVLGSLHITLAKKYLTLSLLFIGLGVLLVVVVGVGWRCTPQGHEPCHVLFNLGAYSNPPNNRNGNRGNRARREREWHGGPLYAEFQHRRPPPSYTASMHQYNQQQRANQNANRQADQRRTDGAAAAAADNLSLPSSPPPTYRSRASTGRPGIHITFPESAGDYPTSRPPTYRSHAGDIERPGIGNITQEGVELYSGRNVDTHGTQTVSAFPLSGENGNLDVATMQIHSVDMQPMPNTRINSNTYTRRVHTGTAESQRISTNNGHNSAGLQRGSVDSPFSTLHRANEVVQYLDGVLNEQSADYSTTPSPETPPRSRTGASRRSRSNADSINPDNARPSTSGVGSLRVSQNRVRSNSSPANTSAVHLGRSSQSDVPSASNTADTARSTECSTGESTSVYKIEMSGKLGGVDLNLKNIRLVNQSESGNSHPRVSDDQHSNNADLSNRVTSQSVNVVKTETADESEMSSTASAAHETIAQGNHRNSNMNHSNQSGFTKNTSSNPSNVSVSNNETNLLGRNSENGTQTNDSVSKLENRGVGSMNVLNEEKSDVGTQTGTVEDSGEKEGEEEEEISDTQL